MKTFEDLFSELQHKAATRPEGSGTVEELDRGVHFIGKKLVEEAALCCSSLKGSSKVFMGLGYRKAGGTLTDRCPMTSVRPGRLAALSTGACDGVSHRRVMSCPEATVVGSCADSATPCEGLGAIPS